MTAPASFSVRKFMAPPLSFRAEVVPSSLNEEARTVELIWSTGAKGLRHSWWDGPFWEELSMEAEHVRLNRLNNGAPLLDSHSGWSVLDVLGDIVEGTARIEGGKGYCTVRLPTMQQGGDEETEKVWQRLKARFIKNVSVGYRIYKIEKVESTDGSAPTHRVIDWEPYEVSLVPMGFDDDAKVRSGSNGTRAAGPELNEVEIITRTTQSQESPALTTPTKTDDTNTAAANEAAIKAAAEAARNAEQARIGAINDMLARAGLPETTTKDFATKFVKDNTSVDEARAAIFDEVVKRQPPEINNKHEGRITVGDGEQEHFERSILSALLCRVQGGDLIARAQAAKVEGFDKLSAEAGAKYRGRTLLDLARISLERAGVKTDGMSRMELAGRAFTHVRSGVPYQGTSDFPVLLENLMGKIMLAAYKTQPDTWRRFCKIETVADFRETPRYRLGSLSVLESLTENGEYKNKVIPDGEKSTIRVDTKGNIIGITRKLIVNDDMGALDNLFSALGRGAALTVETDVYALLAANGGLGPTQSDTQPFFHANRKNVGTGSALTADGVDADIVLMAAQTDPSGNEILDLVPTILLVHRGQRMKAQVLNTSAINPDANGKIQQPNGVLGAFSDIVSTSRVASTTRRYLFADPNVAPAVIVAFLGEQGQSPVLESEQGWRIDGVEMKVRYDFLAQMGDFRGAVTNAGA